MASAKAFIATDVGGVRDLMLGDATVRDGYAVFRNGILIPSDSSVLTSALTFLRDRPELRQTMGQAGRDFLRSRFTAQRLADDLETLYIEIARSKKVRLDRPGIDSSAVHEVSSCVSAREELLPRF
jgi:glycosyltransferase involved in cell wall biosynthesis